MTDHVPDTHQSVTATEPLALKSNLVLGHNAEDVERWYCVSREGMATLCVDEDDANDVAAESWVAYPSNGPYRAARLVDAAALDRLRSELLRAQEAAERWKGIAEVAREMVNSSSRIGGIAARLGLGA